MSTPTPAIITGEYQKSGVCVWGGGSLWFAAYYPPGDHLRAAQFPSPASKWLLGMDDPPQGLRPVSGSPPRQEPHTRTLERTCPTPVSCSYTLPLLCLFNLCQVSQDQNFPKPFPQIQAFAGDPNPPGRQEKAETERPRTRSANLTCASHGSASAPEDPQVPRTVPAASHARPAHSPAGGRAARLRGPASRSDLRRRASAPGVGSTLRGGGGRWPVPGRAAGRREPARGARPGGSAPSPSERASGAGGAICNRADATTAPYSRGAGAGGQVTAAHPPPPSRVVPAQEEPPGAL